MTSSAWMDIAGLLAANELTATNLETGEAVTNPELVEGLSNLPDKSANSASCRWAVCISESSKLELQLQCLPAPINLLTGKPIFKRYTFKSIGTTTRYFCYLALWQPSHSRKTDPVPTRDRF